MGAFVEMILDVFTSFDFMKNFVDWFRDRHKQPKNCKNGRQRALLLRLL